MNIYDIAQLCNVSTATVSRVLNGNPKVSEATRAKVMDAITSSGYVPSSYARSLGSGSTKMIGIVCSNISDMFYAEAVSLIEDGLRGKNYDCILYCAKGNSQMKLDGIHMLSKQVDALIFIGSLFREPIKSVDLSAVVSDVPIFVINGTVPGENVYSIISDEVSILNNVIIDMRDQKLERIMYIYDSLSYSGRKKLEGYKSGLSACKLNYNEALICCVDRNLDTAQSQIEDVISSGIEFDAIIASEDLFAIAAQKAMGTFDITRPIVSFNNSILATCANPRLTSIDFMLDTMCSTAINMLFDLILGKRIPSKVVISPVMVERDTFKPKRKQNY